jgi:tetratricopeptide (TPR) repeat protein
VKRLFSQQGGNHRDYILHTVVFLIAICTRAFFLIWIDEPIIFIKYPFFAEKLANGVDIGERLVDLSPFYLYFLTLIKTLFGVSWTFIKCFQIVIGAINALLVFVIGIRLFNRSAAFIGALIFAFYGNLIVLETTLEPTVFVLLFNLLSVYFLILSGNKSESQNYSILNILAAGVFTGMGIITKPNFLLFLPVGVAWILIFRKTDFGFGKNLVHTLLFLCTTFLIISPITARNYLKLHDFVLVTADAGKVFFHGNSKTATAIVGADLLENDPYVKSNSDPDFAHVVFRKTASRIAGETLSPSQSTRFWINMTLKDILDDPRLYLTRQFRKFVHFFTDYEIHYIASAHKEYKKTLSFPFLRYGIIIALGFLGILLSFKKFKTVFLIYGAISVYLVSCTMFLVNARYRTPAVPYFCLFTGYAIYCLQDMARKRQFKRLCICIIFLSVFYFSTHASFKSAVLKHDRWQEATKIHYEMDGRPAFKGRKYKDAVTALNKCIGILPNFYPAYILRGRSYAILGDYKKAEADFNHAIFLNPENPKGHKNIGFIYLLQKKRDAAENAFNKALKHDPRNEKIRETLTTLVQKKEAEKRMDNIR